MNASSKSTLNTKNITQICLPLLVHFVHKQAIKNVLKQKIKLTLIVGATGAPPPNEGMEGLGAGTFGYEGIDGVGAGPCEKPGIVGLGDGACG